ncbi:hypothetical protein K2173_019208 [Erythroxylum novogranatense]|uniref:Uncharacterized protein n=1 Tax=Erythroxylum novogranatense TaxID=1862640 RepID=A0AAV8ST30_9ROSI|nr:hypothetical protein K2173_019208 [Erythroxylum novogranatense]
MRRKLFHRLAKEAQNSRDLFTVGDIGVGKEKIYGLVECIHGAGCRCIIKASPSLELIAMLSKVGSFTPEVAMSGPTLRREASKSFRVKFG